ncbi:hypothetical protein DBR11_12875 [Pedobacter sp. HMWF019]|uniref:LiaF transmembrane domain-containing protein n=1 Tax=Pedobacter sp. HMWF019 TaxID=2056856 RepID=UPI000D35409D|nr:DUF5668 domain-containing protein [Pedobacter sp. HMWF019]PTS99177.1 hypothetical protein DBR11_12875 [Pedobacter sp. HMWF019]
MKLDRIMWGIILLFIGGVLLLENFNVINFYWRNVWGFWPVFLIIAGVNILFNRQKSQLGGAISIGVLVVMLGFLFYKGQQPPKNKWLGDNLKTDLNLDEDDQDSTSDERGQNFSEPYTAENSKKVILNISGGGTTFNLNGNTDSLIQASVKDRRGNFSLKKETNDSTQVITFKSQDKKGKWSINDGGNDVDFKLNKQPEWEMNVSMGAGEVDFDLADYKIRSFRFDGGAAALKVKVGDLLPVTDVVVKTGVADVNINVPTSSGCRITAKTGLSSKDFPGFIKINGSTYETPNYASAAKKIFIALDGGLSSFEVKRY